MAAAAGVAVLAATSLAACGDGMSAEEASARIAAECTAAHTAMRPPAAPAGAPRRTQLVEVLSAYNALDARLDALPVDGDHARRVEALRAALQGGRAAFARQYKVAARAPGPAPAARSGLPPAFATMDTAAAAAGAPACRGTPMGASLHADIARATLREAAAAGYTGDFTTDVSDRCRSLPRSLAIPARIHNPAQAQAWALQVRGALQDLSAVLARSPRTPIARRASREARGVIARDAALLAAYTESVRTGSYAAARRAAADHAVLVGRLRTILRRAGVACD